ncbi:MAG: IS66 family transposase [Acidobacteriaceae bacterium]
MDTTWNELHYAQLKIQVLEERLRQQRIAKYGPGSETLSNLQLELLELEPGVSRQEVAAESERAALPGSSQDEKKKRRPHPGRQTLPADLPRVEKIVACTPEQCRCGNCGADTKVIDYEVSEVLAVKPAEYFVQVTKREKRACKQCEEQGVAIAPAPVRIIDKSLVSDPLIIDTVMNKYADSLPLYRQSAMLKRDVGIDISRATMDGWVMRVGELLTPVAAAMRAELLGGSYIQADETPVDVQMGDGRGQNKQAYLWQYRSPGGSAVFDFRMGRERDGPLRFLSDYEGILQTDGYAAYDRVGGPKMVHAACWAHARRKFVDALKLNPQDAVAARSVALMDELFAIDARVRTEQMDLAARHALRQQQVPPLLDRLRAHILAAQTSSLPGSATGKAVHYTLALWQKLTRLLDYPELELSNNIAENSMRPISIGRKNWIHIGSAQAGPKIAAIFSVVESCRRLRLPIRDYLAAVLPGLANTSVQRPADLTPAWQKSIAATQPHASLNV